MTQLLKNAYLLLHGYLRTLNYTLDPLRENYNHTFV